MNGLPKYQSGRRVPVVDADRIKAAVAAIGTSRKPGLYLGWGARDASALAVELAELLGAPVATTLQGLSVFPANHPLHTGMGFGPSAVRSAQAFEDCDCLTRMPRFAELATEALDA